MPFSSNAGVCRSRGGNGNTVSRRTIAPAEQRWLVAYYRLWAFPGGMVAFLCWLGVGVWGLADGYLVLGLVMIWLAVPLGAAIVRERRRTLRMDDR